jgi:type IV pilus assembly protein PilM
VNAETSEKEETLNLMAVGVERELIDEAISMVSKAGLNLVKAAPSICAYISLIRKQMNELKEYTDEFCILDLGHEATRMYMFKEDQYEATRVIELGLSSLERVIADLYGVETHLAHTYITNNFQNCLDREECRESYDNIAVELMRAMNFYRFSNPDSSLTDMWLCGGGAAIGPLTTAIGEMLDMRLHTASELVPDGDDIPNCNAFVQAVGISFE